LAMSLLCYLHTFGQMNKLDCHLTYSRIVVDLKMFIVECKNVFLKFNETICLLIRINLKLNFKIGYEFLNYLIFGRKADFRIIFKAALRILSNFLIGFLISRIFETLI
jgi:hypothetical protein